MPGFTYTIFNTKQKQKIPVGYLSLFPFFTLKNWDWEKLINVPEVREQETFTSCKFKSVCDQVLNYFSHLFCLTNHLKSASDAILPESLYWVFWNSWPERILVVLWYECWESTIVTDQYSLLFGGQIRRWTENRKKSSLFLSFSKYLVNFHLVLVPVLGTGDEEGNEADKIPILMEYLSQQVLVPCGPWSSQGNPLHSYKDAPTSRKDAHALGPPGPEERQAIL